MSIYRYKLSPELVEKILYFSKLHEFEERKDYVENWKLWCEENTLEIQAEEKRLLDLGYTGDVLNKMFKSLLDENKMLKPKDCAQKLYDYLFYEEELKTESHGRLFLLDKLKVYEGYKP